MMARRNQNLPGSDGAAHVDVWHLTVPELADDAIDALRALLDADENIAANRYMDAGDRRRFIVRRAMRRSLLSTYLDVPFAALRVESAPGGKPVIVAPPPPGSLHVSVSSSRDVAAIAISCNADVGIDVEYRRDFRALCDTAELYFSEAERAALDDLDPRDLRVRFFDIWTRKEALLKGIGLGLRAQASHIDARSAVPVYLEGARTGPLDWSLHTLSLHRGYSAAVAVRHTAAEIEIRRWIPESAARDATLGRCRSGS